LRSGEEEKQISHLVFEALEACFYDYSELVKDSEAMLETDRLQSVDMVTIILQTALEVAEVVLNTDTFILTGLTDRETIDTC